jgi:predicted GNAT family N-acyltransferase
VGNVRIARTDEERRAIYRLRFDVYVAEQRKAYPGVDPDRRELVDDVDRLCTHYFVDGPRDIRAACRSYLGPPTPRLEEAFSAPDLSTAVMQPLHYVSRFCVAPAARRTLVPWRLAKAAYCHGRACGVTLTFLHCAPHLAPLYERLGYERYRDPFDDPVVGLQIPLRLYAADEDWLRRRQSPFAPLARLYRESAAGWSVALRETFDPSTLQVPASGQPLPPSRP